MIGGLYAAAAAALICCVLCLLMFLGPWFFHIPREWRPHMEVWRDYTFVITYVLFVVSIIAGIAGAA